MTFLEFIIWITYNWTKGSLVWTQGYRSRDDKLENKSDFLIVLTFISYNVHHLSLFTEVTMLGIGDLSGKNVLLQMTQESKFHHVL